MKTFWRHGAKAFVRVGTREPITTSGGPIQYRKLFGYHCYSAGYEQNGNRSTGILIGLLETSFKLENIVQISYPDQKCIWGRGLAIRYRNPNVDLLLTGKHLPSDTDSHRARRDYSATLKWHKQLHTTNASRTLRITGTDVNDKVGLVSTPAGYSEVNCDYVGPFGQQSQRKRADFFSTTSFRHITSTCVHVFPHAKHSTYFSPTFDSESRIDDWEVPLSFLQAGNVFSCKPCYGLANEAQLINSVSLTDHVPIELIADINLDYDHVTDRPQPTIWCKHSMMQCLFRGDQRRQYSHDAEKRFVQHIDEWTSLAQLSLTMQWEFINKGVRAVAEQYFTMQNRCPQRFQRNDRSAYEHDNNCGFNTCSFQQFLPTPPCYNNFRQSSKHGI